MPNSIITFLPRNVQNYIIKNKITIIKKIERVMELNCFWELEVVVDGIEYELKFDSRGRLISYGD